jgi:hypothetical protein
MTCSEDIRAVVLQFYRRLYDADGRDGFFCRGNDIFMHPVLTPNFFPVGVPTADQLAVDRRRFRESFGQDRHWLQLFPDQDSDSELAAAGYSQSMDCAFNVFTHPILVRQVPGIGLAAYDSVPESIRSEYERKTDSNSHSLSPVVLRCIERVLRAAADSVAVCVAQTPDGQLAGAVTVVRAGPVSLFVNAWVDQPERGRGIMSFLYAESLRRELTEGQEAAFYWTFNPIISAKGNLSGRVRVFEASNSL